MKFFLTCEHGGNKIPPEYRQLFRNADQDLKTHKAYDLGALDLFRFLEPLADQSFFSVVSRLLVELNRSPHHPQLFSRYSRSLSEEEKEKVLKSYFYPYRNAVEKVIRNSVQAGEKVLHISVHSFTPELNGTTRNADIGLLYDPKKEGEKKCCVRLKENIRTKDSDLRLRFNYPYLGKADGFTSYLRKTFPQNYSGIELEVNQKYSENNKFYENLKQVIFKGIKDTLTNF